MSNQRNQLRETGTLECIASQTNLFRAATLARKGKSRRPDVEEWWLRRETHIMELSRQLLGGAWKPGPYHFFEIREPKRRLIAAAPFSDRVVHHALCLFLQPMLERRFIARSFSCQIGKGTTAARTVCRKLTNQYRYVLKCDVHKFFHQIDHQILTARLEQEVLCPGARRLIGLIISSFATDSAEIPPLWFPGDEDLFSASDRKRGLPIGNLTSQLWGNFYLDGMDHAITEGCQHGAYLRYTDDFLLFADSKKALWTRHRLITAELAKLRLRLAQPKSRLLQTAEGVPFCGFRFLPGQAPRVLGATKRRFEKRRSCYETKGLSWREGIKRDWAWYQFASEGNATGLVKAYQAG